MSSVAVVIPNWNRADLLRAVLKNLSEQTVSPAEVVVVDNGSTDESCVVAEAAGAKVICFESNRGFAPAVNAGIRASVAEWVLILNNDVALNADWIERAQKTAEVEFAAFATGKLLSFDDPSLIDGTWDLLCRGGHAWRTGFLRPDGPLWNARRAIDFAPMTAALFRRSVFERAGYLDERFEAYYEDVDFGLRCAAMGLRGVYEPAAIGRHRGKNTLGKDSGRVLYLTARNQLFAIAKNYSSRQVREWLWPIVVAQALSLLGAARAGHSGAALRGIRDGLSAWSAMRKSVPVEGDVNAVLERCEAEIYRLQRSLGCDPYWRLYFRLVRPYA